MSTECFKRRKGILQSRIKVRKSGLRGEDRSKPMLWEAWMEKHAPKNRDPLLGEVEVVESHSLA